MAEYNDNITAVADELKRKYGILPAENAGVLGGLWKGTAQTAVSAIRGIGSTLEESGHEDFGGAIREWGDDTLRNNQDWNRGPNEGIGGFVGRSIGSALGTGAVMLPAIAADMAFGTKGAASFAMAYNMSFGDNLKRNREAYGPGNEEKSYGLAALESSVDALTEVALGTVPMLGKTLKGLTFAGKRQLIKGMFNEAAKDLGRKGAQRFFLGLAKNGMEEGAEEAVQYVNSWVWRALGGDPNNEFSVKELAENTAAGAIGGAALGVIGGANEMQTYGKQRPWLARNMSMKTGQNQIFEQEINGKKVRGVYTPDGEFAPVASNPDATAGRTAMEGLYEEFGIPLSRMTKEEQQTEGIGKVGENETNGLYDKKTGEVKINPDNEGEVFSHGHELDHWLTDQHPDVAEALHRIMDEEVNENGKALQSNPEELHADLLGKIVNDPLVLIETTQRLEEMQMGFGEKFLNSIIEFSKKVMAYLKQNPGLRGAEQYFNNYKRMRDAAIQSLVEIRKRQKQQAEQRVKFENGELKTENAENIQNPVVKENLTTAENPTVQKNQTVQKPESGPVQSIPVSELNVDPARFQFKRGADKVTGVDKSNQIGGEWDPKTAGNIYVWEDKNGKKYVVNGHHRLALAKEKGVRNMNAIVDREADGVTAEQAKRNGTLINIRDEQGDIEDYAEFIRNEKMDEARAEKEGILKRQKGKTGFTIGRYSSDNLYHRFHSGDMNAATAATIADIARGDESLEGAGIKAAKDGMPVSQLREFLKLLKNTPKENTAAQGDLFGFDDSAIRQAETLSGLAAKHIRAVKEKINAAKGAVNNPEAAKKLGVTTKKNAQALLDNARKEEAEWENWHTNPKLYGQLMAEAGFTEEKTDEPETEGKQAEKPVVKENLTTEEKSDLPQKTESKIEKTVENAKTNDTLRQQPEEVKHERDARDERRPAERSGRTGNPVEHGGVQEGSASGIDREQRNNTVSAEKIDELSGTEGKTGSPGTEVGSSAKRGTGNRQHASDGDRSGNGTERVDRSGSEDSKRLVEEGVSGRAESDGTLRGSSSGDTGRRSVLETEQHQAKSESDYNHRIKPEDTLIPGGDKQKVKANLKAIKLLKKLEEENRNATPEEKKILAQYVGWGGLKNVFDRWSNDYVPELKELLSQEEYESARQSILNAHYTNRGVIEKMWKLAHALGFRGGRVGEFGAGVGHFLGLIPDNLVKGTRFKAVEMDSVSGRLLKKLYPEADVTIAGLQETKIANNSLSMVIGNVPFSDTKISDKRYPSKFNLHNYFIARSIDAVKPGGLVITISSHGTLDAMGTSARMYFAEKADFLGAVRLPSNTFKKNAGTDVVTDILVFRKKDGTLSTSERFIGTVPFEMDDKSVPINEYFSVHPDMMLGKASIGHGMYRDNMFNLDMPAGMDLSKEIDSAMGKIFRAHPPKKNVDSSIVEPLAENTAKGNLKDGELYIEDGKLKEWHTDSEGNDISEEIPAKNESINKRNIEKVSSFQKLKSAHNQLINAMLNDCSDEELKNLQGNLKKAYDSFLKNFGNIADYRKQALLRDDPTYLRAAGLELVEQKTENGKKVFSYTPADIFTKRTIIIPKEPESAANAKEAADISMKFRGNLNPGFMEKLTGKPFEELKRELIDKGFYFEDPSSGLLVDKADYLSGNIKKKLEEAEEQAKLNDAFQKNVDALKKVMPKPKNIDGFQFRLGARWIPVDLIRKWCEEDLKANHVNIQYNKALDKYTISGGFYNVKDFYAYSFGPEDFIEAALSMRRMQVWVKDAEGKRKIDNEKTQAAEDLKQKIAARFHDYVKGNPEATKILEDAFNSEINIYVPRELSERDTNSVYPGASDVVNGKPFRLRGYQRNAVDRAQKQNTLFAHCVGAGKTATMITSAMELVRTGMAKKPMIVVQNATVMQFGTSAANLYPAAKILCTTKDDFEKSKRRRTMSKIANNEWDLIILPQSQFNLLDVKPETVESYYNDFINELRAVLEQTDDRFSQREIANKIEKFKEKISSLKDKRTAKDDTLYFEELGIDALFIDEAHAYKKPFFTTALKRIKGLSTQTSERSVDLSMKLSEIMKRTGGKNIFFATGTPITNTLAEAWHMVRYLTPKGQMPYGCETFDQFASMFCEVETVTEANAAGQYQNVDRFSKFTNLNELSIFFRSVADIVLPEDLKSEVKRPPLKNGKPTEIVIEKSPEMEKFMKFLKDTYLWYKSLSGKEKIEAGPIPLLMNTYAVKATADMRLISPKLADIQGSKISRCAEEVKKRYDQWNSVKGTQLIFLDTFRHINNGQVDFNAYDEIKRKLIQQGIPADEIQIITEFSTDKAKEKLFEDVNAGRVRVLIGGTETLGTGVNVQERLCATHNIDATYMPSGMEQRNGRILRQGNTIPEVEILDYAVKGTLDEVKYQLLARKKNFIDSVMRGDSRGDFEEENEENMSYEKFAAMISGNPDAMKFVKVKDEAKRLNTSYQLFLSQQAANKNELHNLQTSFIPRMKENIKQAEESAKRLESFDFENFNISYGGKQVTADKKSLQAVIDKYINSGKHTVLNMNINGLDIELDLNRDSETKNIYKLGDEYSAAFGSGDGFTKSLFSWVRNAEKRIEKAKEALEKGLQEEKAIQESIKAEFPDMDKMLEVEGERDRLAKILTTSEGVEIPYSRPSLTDYINDAVSDDALDEEFKKAKESLDADEGKQYSLKRKQEISDMPAKAISEEQKKEILDAYDYAMNGKPVARLSGQEFQKDGTPLTEKVTRFYQEQYNGKAVHPELGEVKLDLEGVKDSLGHGIGSVKAAAYAAVPQMIENGKIFDRQKNWKGRGYDTVVMVAPLEISGVSYVGEVVVKQGTDRQGFYLHEVEIKEKLADVFKTANGSTSPVSRLIISHLIEKIKRDSEENQGNSEIQHSLKHRNQVNPIREAGPIRDEYQNKLDNAEYETRSDEEVTRLAEQRIKTFGGFDEVSKMILEGDFKLNSDIGQRIVQLVLNSDEFKKLEPEQRDKIADVYMNNLGTEAGRSLAARRLGALNLNDIKSVQAHINAFVAKIDKKNPKNKLREDIKKQFDFDIDSLPEGLTKDWRTLDELIRRLSAEKASKGDKFYEFWINSILSGPTTHAANFIGNTANAVYELGLKRFVEATVNIALRNPNAATFGEFKEMIHAFDWRKAWLDAKLAFDLETLTGTGKLDQAHVAIGGKAGRLIRAPGRLLRAADQFAKAIITPMETAAFAYREGRSIGKTGSALKAYIEEQMKKTDSRASEWGHSRALELTFQEDPGKAVMQLIRWRDGGGVFGGILKFVLPFMKTPANILKQGVRKSVFGGYSLVGDIVQIARGQKSIDSKTVELAAEQLIAWGTFAMLYGMNSGDDDEPFITGSSARYGSAEQRYKAGKIPPYSIRIGDTWYSYKRIEPLSTGLAFLADGIAALKAAKRGEDGTKIIKKMFGGVKELIVDKSFLDSLGEINRIVSEPDRSAAKYLTNFAASWVPNAVKQVVNAFDDNVRDNKTHRKGLEWWEDQFFITTNSMGITKAAPRYDYLGRPIKKDALEGPAILARLLPINMVTPQNEPVDELLQNYNRAHEDEYYPPIPSFRFKRDGKNLYFSGDNYAEFAHRSGELAHKQIKNAFRHGLLRKDKPTEKDIALLKKIFHRAKKVVREKMYREKKYSE